MVGLAALLGAAALAAFVPAAQGEDPPAPPRPPQCTPSSQGQQGGQIACTIINEGSGRPRDPQRRALGAVMVRYGAQMHQVLEPFRAGNVHAVLYDPRDPYFAGQVDRTYVFVIVPAELVEEEEADICVFQNGFALLGVVATFQGDAQVNVEERPIPLEDLLFQAVCDSLGADARQAWGGAPSPSASGAPLLTNYDVLSRGRRTRQVIVLASGTRDGLPYEQRALREYWGAALAGVDPTALAANTDRMLQRELGPVAAAATRARADETGVYSFSLDRAAFDRSRSFENITDGARRYFGRAFEEMDAAWTRALAAATLTIDAQPRPVMTGGRYQPPLERFRISEIGSPRFWRHFSDGAEFLLALDCVAARFAVDQDYATAADMPAYGGCETAQRSAGRPGRE